MRLGVVSDTHGHVEFATDAIRILSSENVDAVIHCGDIGSASIVPLFADWPTHFVFGNVDFNEALLRSTINDCSQTCHNRFGDVTLEGKRIAVLHGDEFSRMQETIHSGAYDLICSGHTHVPSLQRHGETILLNPGALYRAPEHTIAIVELPSLDIRHVTVPQTV